MRQILREEDAELDLHFAAVEEALQFFADAERQQGFVLHLERKLKQFQRLRVTIVVPQASRFSCEVEVMQLFPGPGTFGTAFRLVDWSAERQALLEQTLRGEAAEPASRGADTRPGRIASADQQSPIFRIKKMNPNERYRLAMKAGRPERQILLRDTSPQVLMGLLSHPRIEDKEVLELIKSNYASGGILQRVADNKKWMGNVEIRTAIVRSPKTPPQVALKHLPSLRTSELQAMAKGAWVRETLRKAALKLYLQRTGRR